MTNPNIGDRVQWIGVRTGLPRRGVVIAFRGSVAEIRTEKGGYTAVEIGNLEVLA